MAEATIPVDLRNPGQVMACLGLMEAAEVLFGEESAPAGVIGRYAWNLGETSATFTLSSARYGDPVHSVLKFLSRSVVSSYASRRQLLSTVARGIPTHLHGDDECAFSPPDSPAELPIRLMGRDLNGETKTIRIEYWGDSPASGRDNVKFWGGNCWGSALGNDAVLMISTLGDDALTHLATDPFAHQARMSSSYNFDWRRSYVPLDAGFSPNVHGGSTAMVGYPFVELLAAIGLQHARPERVDRRDKLNYRYSVAAAALPLPFARAVLGGQTLGFPARTFRMRLGWPGQEGQARCILDAQEEIRS